MSDRTSSKASIAACLDYLLFNSNEISSSGFEDIIQGFLKDCPDGEVGTRYRDFFSLTSVVNTDKLEEFGLQNILLSVDSLQRKYKDCISETAWLNAKLDILFQIYLCILREPAGVISAISVATLRNRIENQMEKYKSYYLTATSALHPMYAQQREWLMSCACTDKSTTEQSPIGAEKVNALLNAHDTDDFKLRMVSFIRSVEEKALPIPVSVKVEYSNLGPASHGCQSAKPLSAQQLLPQQRKLQYDVPEDAEADYRAHMDEADESFLGQLRYKRQLEFRQAHLTKEDIEEEARLVAEDKRRDKLRWRYFLFMKNLLAVYEERGEGVPPGGKDPTFEAYFQGRDTVNGMGYTKSWKYDDNGSKCGLLVTDDGLELVNYDGIWNNFEYY